jgi:hypothetical protein
MFDVRTAIAGLYLWLIFGYLSTMVSCDVQRMMKTNHLFRHIVGCVSFFLLFTVIDKDNDANIGSVWMKTFMTYFVFLLMTKSKWYFSLPVLTLIVIDQSLKYQIEFVKNKSPKDDSIANYEDVRDIIYKTIGVLIGTGFLHYAGRQYLEFGSDFSFRKLLFHYECRT